MAYYDSDSGKLKVAHFRGTWQIATVDPADGSPATEVDTGGFAALAMVSVDLLDVAYYDWADRDLRFAASVDIALTPGVTVEPNQSVPFPITLASPAPPGGVIISLSSSNPEKATITPSGILIPAGAKTPAVPPQVNGVDFGATTITASAFGFKTSTQQVRVITTARFDPSIVTVGKNASVRLSLLLSSPAPANGLTLDLRSDNPAAASLDASVTLNPGSTGRSILVTTLAPGTAVIHASSAFVPDATATVTVTAAGSNIPIPVPVG
jgi:hypothetical protein